MNQPSTTFFASYIKNARTQLRMTQGDLANLWGKSQAFVSNIECDIGSIDKGDILSLSQALGLPASELLEAAGFLAADATEIILKPGRRVVVVCEGEPGRIINLDEGMLAALNVLAIKQAKKARAKIQGTTVHKPREKSI